jgi:hypothetical protein
MPHEMGQAALMSSLLVPPENVVSSQPNPA